MAPRGSALAHSAADWQDSHWGPGLTVFEQHARQLLPSPIADLATPEAGPLSHSGLALGPAMPLLRTPELLPWSLNLVDHDHTRVTPQTSVC